MTEEENYVEEEQKKLVLERLKTLNPESKILLGGDTEITVRQLIKDVEEGSVFGKNVVRIQIKMLRLLTSEKSGKHSSDSQILLMR